MTEIEIKFGDLIKMPPGGFDALPDSPNPYHIGSKDGLFVHRRMAFGRGVAKLSHWPESFPEMGTSTGIFTFDADPIPGELMAKVVSFFRRIYEKQKTEAAVILTMDRETKEWGLFIPTQLVSHGGVNYVFDPAHIHRSKMVVGSIHSHCDFSAFHSGVDTGDAAEFDGFHCTIGHITRDIPEIVAMVSMNKQNLHYKADQFPALFDFTQLDSATAPEWWDQYVGTNQTGGKNPVGYELYKKFEKPTLVKSHTTSGGPNPQRWVPGQGWTPSQQQPKKGWDREAYLAQQMENDWGISAYGYYGGTPYKPQDESRGKEPWWAEMSVADLKSRGYAWDDDLGTYKYVGPNGIWVPRPNQITGSQPLKESVEFNRRQSKKEKKRARRMRMLSKEETAELADMFSHDHWEDMLEQDVLDAIFDSGCITEEDIEYALEAPDVAGDLAFWKEKMLTKAYGAAIALLAMGVEVKLSVSTIPMLPAPAAETGEQHDGVH